METSERISLAAIMVIALALLNQPARADGLLPPPPPPTAFPAAARAGRCEARPGKQRPRAPRAGLSKVQLVDQRMRLECGVGFHPGLILRAIAANISELLRSLDKPLLAELPFLAGC
jgi:hypothetical protein